MTIVYVYIVLLALAMLVVRVETVASRSMDYRADADLNAATLGFLTVIATFALIAYGFVHFRWYWPLIGIAAGLGLQLLVTRSSFGAFYAFHILLEIVAVGGTFLIWLIR